VNAFLAFWAGFCLAQALKWSLRDEKDAAEYRGGIERHVDDLFEKANGRATD